MLQDDSAAESRAASGIAREPENQRRPLRGVRQTTRQPKAVSEQAQTAWPDRFARLRGVIARPWQSDHAHDLPSRDSVRHKGVVIVGNPLTRRCLTMCLR